MAKGNADDPRPADSATICPAFALEGRATSFAQDRPMARAVPVMHHLNACQATANPWTPRLSLVPTDLHGLPSLVEGRPVSCRPEGPCFTFRTSRGPDNVAPPARNIARRASGKPLATRSAAGHGRDSIPAYRCRVAPGAVGLMRRGMLKMIGNRHKGYHGNSSPVAAASPRRSDRGAAAQCRQLTFRPQHRPGSCLPLPGRGSHGPKPLPLRMPHFG